MELYTLPVSIQTMIMDHEETIIYYPQVTHLDDQKIQQKVNAVIIEHTQHLIHQQYIQQDTDSFAEMIGLYEIKTNERNILSLSLSNYAYAPRHAHGLTMMTSLTFDLRSGKIYQLADLFQRDSKDSDYQTVLGELIQEQIRTRDIPLINRFPGVLPDQDYYIADKSLVIYYALYELTPYYYGFPMFPISVYQLDDIIDENGPLGLMAINN